MSCIYTLSATGVRAAADRFGPELGIWRPVDFLSEPSHGFLDSGPALIPEAPLDRALRIFPERQRFQQCGTTGWRKRQHAASVTSFRPKNNIASLLQRPQIPR